MEKKKLEGELAKLRMDKGRPKEGVEDFPQDNSGKSRDKASEGLGVTTI